MYEMKWSNLDRYTSRFSEPNISISASVRSRATGAITAASIGAAFMAAISTSSPSLTFALILIVEPMEIIFGSKFGWHWTIATVVFPPFILIGEPLTMP